MNGWKTEGMLFVIKETLELGLKENMVHWNGNESTESEAKN